MQNRRRRRATSDDSWRPEIHFRPPRHWMNDPNGLFYADGTYHLFYQYSSQSPRYETISWGHAISRDLVHWRHLPIAIRGNGSGSAYSGTALVDRDNRSRLGGDRPPHLAFFTNCRHCRAPEQRQTIDLAYSLDGGSHWRRSSRNPLIDTGRRAFDAPFVFRFESGFRMLVGEPLSWAGWREGLPSRFVIYKSDDLLHWERVGQIGPFGKRTELWEVPVLVRMRVAGERRLHKWVLIWSTVDRAQDRVRTGTRYLVGEFDGVAFRPGSGGTRGAPLDWGPDVYAPLVWTDAPAGPFLIAWMNTWTYARRLPDSGGGALTVPRRLRLERGESGFALTQAPIAALRTLRGVPTVYKKIALCNERRSLEWDYRSQGDALELLACWRPGDAVRCGLRLAVGKNEWTEVGLDFKAGMLYLDRRRSGIVSFAPEFPAVYRAAVDVTGGRISLHILVDRSSVEVFADGGVRVLTARIFPAARSGGVEIFATGGSATLERLTLWPLASIWSGVGNQSSG
ncbi:MAG: glycoside hydrolase family 32 protein [Vicinamibacterales bacterium]